MAGASITVKQVVPQQGKNLIYFTGTGNSAGQLDFSAYSGVDWVSCVVSSSQAVVTVSAYTVGGDIEFSSGARSTAVKGMAIVTY